MFNKAVRRRSTPLRVARRKMRTNVPVTQRAEQSVGQGMQGNVGVTMPSQSLVMIDLYAAEPKVFAGCQPVDVIA